MLRIRRQLQEDFSNVVIGHVDYVCLTPGSSSVSFLSSPIEVRTSVGVGQEKVSIDENHGALKRYDVGGPLFLSTLLRPLYTKGGGVYLSKPGVLPPGASTHNGFDGSDWRTRYTGSFILSPRYSDLWKSESALEESRKHPVLNPSDLDSLGSRAYAKLRPKVAKAGVFQSVAEAKSVLPMVKQSAEAFSQAWEYTTKQVDLMPRHARKQAMRAWRMLPKKTANHFINHQFGWVPFVRDITDICDVTINFAAHVEKAQRLNGEWQHRRFFEDETLSEEVLFSQVGTENFCEPLLGATHVVPGSGSIKCVRQNYTRVWYEGSFKQYYPEFDRGLMQGHPAIEKVAQAVRLYGAEINPVNVYKVLPWTWCVDWFANVGDNLQVLQDLATDAVVSKYFYLMRRSYSRVIYRVKWLGFDGAQTSLEWAAGYETKIRRVGQSSFGFSLLPGGLSGKQLAILGALGMSKAT